MKKASKKKASPNWGMWLVVGVILVGAVWGYLQSGVVGSQAGTGGDVVYVGRDSASPLSNLTIGMTSKQIDSRWRLAYSSDDPDPKKQVLLAGVTFTVSNATKVASTAYVRNYIPQGSSPILATAPVKGDRIQFLFKAPIPIKNNSVVKLEMLLDLNRIDGVTTKNDTPYTTKIALPSDVLLLSSALGAPVVKVDQSNPATNYLFKTKPMFNVALDTPTGSLVPSRNMLAFKLKVSADAAGDVAWIAKNLNGMTFELDYSLQDAGEGLSTPVVYRVVDSATGTQLLKRMVTLTPGTKRMMLPAGFESDFWVAAGSSKTLDVYLDTSNFEDAGDSVQISVLPKDKIVWGVEGFGKYLHADILVRGGLYGGVLVKL